MKKDITLFQDNAITRASYEMSALEKDILLMIISQVNHKDSNIPYFIKAQEIIERKGERIKFEDFQKAGKMLVSRTFETMLDERRLLQSSFISSAIYHKGKGMIEVRVDPNVVPLYSDLKKNFTTIQLNAALSLNSKYAKRMYELVSSVKNFINPYMTITVEELKKRLGVSLYTEGVLKNDTYPNFAHFEKRVLIPSLSEMEKTDVRFSYNLIYDKKCVGRGRKAVHALKITVSKVGEPEEPVLETDTILVTRLINEFRLRKDQAITIIGTHDKKAILKSLYDISLERSNIRNIGAYTAEVFGV
jgi:plasmid replication initiation protein